MTLLAHGGADRDRTGDLRRAKPALSQLSYSPKNFSGRKIFDSVHPINLILADSPVPAGRSTKFLEKYLVGLSGLEPLTSRLSGVRSNQLSYRPV